MSESEKISSITNFYFPWSGSLWGCLFLIPKNRCMKIIDILQLSWYYILKLKSCILRPILKLHTFLAMVFQGNMKIIVALWNGIKDNLSSYRFYKKLTCVTLMYIRNAAKCCSAKELNFLRLYHTPNVVQLTCISKIGT